MSWLHRILHRRQVEEDLDREVTSYFEILVERGMERGFSREEAQRAARLQFEGPEQVKQKVREARMGAAFEDTLRDARYALRSLRRSPGFAAVAVLTLALGIGANTAIFSLINAVILRALPVDHPENLVLLTDPAASFIAVDTTENGLREMLSYPEFDQLRAHNTVFSGIFAAQSNVSSLDVFPDLIGGGRSIRANTQLVSGDFFRVLGVEPVLGRTFTQAEDKAPGANPVAVVSYGFWQRELGGVAGAVGSTVRAGQGVFRILGVTPRGFRGILVGSDADIWIPITMQQQLLPGRNYLIPRDTLWLQVMGRLAGGISTQKAEAGINVTFQQILRSWAVALPNERALQGMLNQKLAVRRGAQGASELRGEFSDPLWLLMAMVGVVLLIACANIANLMLARASGRQREIGVRLALGAARSRLIRQLLAESLLVAFFGGLVGLALAAAGTRLLVALVSQGVANLGLDVPRDYRVLLFTAAASLLTGLVFGLAPAIRATRTDINRTLVANGRGSIGGRGRVRSGRILVATQVALSLVLLTGAALLVRSLHNMVSQDLGFDHDRLLMVRLDPVAGGYSGAAMTGFYTNVRQSLANIPGVRSVTFSNTGLFGGDAGDHLSMEGSAIHDPEQLRARWTEVGPDYFRTLGIPLMRGREMDSADAVRGTQVCLVNEFFARHFYPNGDLLGKHITDEYPTTRETFEIVGVVRDAREHSPDERMAPRFYSNIAHPIGQVQAVTFILRSSGDPAAVASAVRKTLLRIEPDVPILGMRTVAEQIGRRLVTQRLLAELAAFFGMAALFMALIGLYGVLSYSMSRRTSEIGIRMALGASARGVVRMVMGETLSMVAFGLAIGLPCALAAGRLISSRLYGVSPADPAAVAVAVAVIAIAAVLAGYVPARRAARIDPTVSLRSE